MRLPVLFQVLRHLLLILLCLSSLWLGTPCMDIRSSTPLDTVCLGGGRRHQRRQENFSARAVAEAAQTRAFLSPLVFLGTLRSVLVQRDGTVRTWFAVDKTFKSSSNDSAEDTEVVYYRTGECVLEVHQDNLKLGSQYIVFGGPGTNSVPATALPIPNEKRTLRAVKKILCKGCAKPPGVSGLERTRVVEGEKARLNCHLTGNPIPWVEWYKDGVKIVSKGRVKVKTKRRTSRLIIRRARLQDRGVYECRAGSIVQRDPVSVRAPLAVTRKKPTKRPTTPPPPTTTTTASTTTQLNPYAPEPCPRADFCLNGATCLFYRSVREYVCECADGFMGFRCQYKDVSISVGEVKNYSSRGDIP